MLVNDSIFAKLLAGSEWRYYLDILTLIRRKGVDIKSPEFEGILDRYATENIRKRLLRDLDEPL